MIYFVRFACKDTAFSEQSDFSRPFFVILQAFSFEKPGHTGTGTL